MPGREEEKRTAYVAKATAEMDALAAAGARMAGNAFATVLFLKGEPNEAERNGAAPLSGRDGDGLRASLERLGYAPEDWCALLTVDVHGAPLSPDVLRRAVSSLAPSTLIPVDGAATRALQEAYAPELVAFEDLDAALLEPGRLVELLGMRTCSLGGFEAALDDPAEKRVMWERLKKLRPLSAPY